MATCDKQNCRVSGIQNDVRLLSGIELQSACPDSLTRLDGEVQVGIKGCLPWLQEPRANVGILSETSSTNLFIKVREHHHRLEYMYLLLSIGILSQGLSEGFLITNDSST